MLTEPESTTTFNGTLETIVEMMAQDGRKNSLHGSNVLCEGLCLSPYYYRRTCYYFEITTNVSA